MKAAISIPDDLFRKADVLARELGKSRSEVYREALAEFLLRRDPESVTSAMDAALDEVGAQLDPWLGEAARRSLERADW